MADETRQSPDPGRGARGRARARTLTKSKLVEGLQASTGLPRADANDLLEGLLELVKGTLEAGETLKVSGFGSFVVRVKAARRGRNPQTGDGITLPRRRVLSFKASRKLRDALAAEGKKATS